MVFESGYWEDKATAEDMATAEDKVTAEVVFDSGYWEEGPASGGFRLMAPMDQMAQREAMAPRGLEARGGVGVLPAFEGP